MKRKYILMSSIIAISALSMVACGSPKVENTTDTNEVVESVESTEEDTSVEDEVVIDVEPETELETEVGEEVDEEVDDVVVEDDSLAAGIASTIKSELGNDYLPNMQVEPENIEVLFGIASSSYEEIYCEMPMISANIDTLIVVKPTSESYDDVLTTLTEYRDRQINDTLQYPLNAVKVQATQVYEKDGYIYYIALFGDTTEYEESDDDLLAHCEEMTSRVIGIIDAN